MNKNQVNTIYPLSVEQIAKYHEDGFVIVPGLFSFEEVESIRQACEEDPTINGTLSAVSNLQGRKYNVAIWTDLTCNTLLSVLPRTARVVDAIEALLGTKCYHWHSKLLRKAPKETAFVDWHQGYGTWYYDGCLFPQIVTCTIAINKNNKENGCLKCLKKSHLLGRIDTSSVNGVPYADPVRLKHILEKLEIVYCEMEQGDVLFFHANTLHASEGNKSDHPRILIHSAFNAVSNVPYLIEGQETHQYRSLEKVPDSIIRDGCYETVFKNQKFHRPEQKGDKYGVFFRDKS